MQATWLSAVQALRKLQSKVKAASKIPAMGPVVSTHAILKSLTLVPLLCVQEGQRADNVQQYELLGYMYTGGRATLTERIEE